MTPQISWSASRRASIARSVEPPVRGHPRAIRVVRTSSPVGTAPYPSRVVERVLRIVAIAISLVVVASFAWFAIDELNGASARNEAKLSADLEVNPSPAAERQR